MLKDNFKENFEKKVTKAFSDFVASKQDQADYTFAIFYLCGINGGLDCVYSFGEEYMYLITLVHNTIEKINIMY